MSLPTSSSGSVKSLRLVMSRENARSITCSFSTVAISLSGSAIRLSSDESRATIEAAAIFRGDYSNTFWNRFIDDHLIVELNRFQKRLVFAAKHGYRQFNASFLNVLGHRGI